MMSHRFFVDTPLPPDATTARLVGPEAHHLRNVLRLEPGQEVVLFDGTGREFAAVIDRVTRGETALHVRGSRSISRELPQRITMGIAFPKGDRQRWMVEKMVELGVARVVPLRTTRSIVQPTAKTTTRLKRTVIEASKQCGRNQLMELGATTDLQDFLHQNAAGAHRWLADVSGAARISRRCEVPGEVYCVIGPEGGLTDEELAAARQADWQIIALGTRILRIETAALALATLAGGGQPSQDNQHDRSSR